jgi:hypothetical protein
MKKNRVNLVRAIALTVYLLLFKYKFVPYRNSVPVWTEPASLF